MMKWAIDDAMIAAARGAAAAPDPIIERRIDVGGIFWRAHQQLGYTIGRAFGFKSISWSGGLTPGMQGAFQWVGFQSDVEKAELLYTSLLIQCARGLDVFTRQWKAQYANYLPKHEAYKSRRAFILGFANEVGGRIKRQRAEATESAQANLDAQPASGTTSVALVLASRDDRVKEYYDEKYGKLRKGRSTSMSLGVSGYERGRAAGAAANLGGTGISGSRGSIGSGS
jgi:hypothetical protein